MEILSQKEVNELLEGLSQTKKHQPELNQEWIDNFINENEVNKFEDELVQYYIVNSELNMSTGKIAAQVAHVATNIAIEMSKTDDDNFMRDNYGLILDYEKMEKFNEWHENNQPKIILRGKQKEMEKLIEQGWFYIRDNGRTEIASGSLTVIGYTPEYKSIMKPIVKRFQLL